MTALVGPLGRRQVHDHRPARRVPRARRAGGCWWTAWTSPTVRLDSYRSQLGVVLQETFLFDGTIRENVAFSRPGRPRRRGPRGLPPGPRGRVRRAVRERLRHRGGGARREAVGRPAAAGLDRPGHPGGPADPDPRRGHVQPGLGVGGPHPAGPVGADAGAHHVRDRPPAVHDPPGGPDPGGGGGGRSSSGAPTSPCTRSAGRYFEMYNRQHGVESNLFLAPGEGDSVPGRRGGGRQGARSGPLAHAGPAGALMAEPLPPLRRALDLMPSPDPRVPGLLIRDPFRYTESVLVLPPPLVPCLLLFDGQHDEGDLRAALVRLTGDLEVGPLLDHLTRALRETGFLEDGHVRGPAGGAPPRVRRGARTGGGPRRDRVPLRPRGAAPHPRPVPGGPAGAGGPRRRPAGRRRPPREPGRGLALVRRGVRGPPAPGPRSHVRGPGDVALRRAGPFRPHPQAVHDAARAGPRPTRTWWARWPRRRAGRVPGGLLPRGRALDRVPGRVPPAPVRRRRGGRAHPVRAVRHHPRAAGGG